MPTRRLTTARSLDPLQPAYALPTAAPPRPWTPRPFKRDYSLDIRDVPGAQPTPEYFRRELPPAPPPPPPRRPLTTREPPDDIAAINRGFRRIAAFSAAAAGRGTDPLQPQYAVHGRVVSDEGTNAGHCAPPRRGRTIGADLSLRTGDIDGATAGSACVAALTVGGIAPAARRDYAMTNSLEGIVGAHAGSALRGPRARCVPQTDPNERDYSFPGDGGRVRSDDEPRGAPVGRSRSAAALPPLPGGSTTRAGIIAVVADAHRSVSRRRRAAPRNEGTPARHDDATAEPRAGAPGWASYAAIERDAPRPPPPPPTAEERWRARGRRMHAPATGAAAQALLAAAPHVDEPASRGAWLRARGAAPAVVAATGANGAVLRGGYGGTSARGGGGAAAATAREAEGGSVLASTLQTSPRGCSQGGVSSEATATHVLGMAPALRAASGGVARPATLARAADVRDVARLPS